MIKIIISGCNGKMGQVMTRMFAARDDMEVVAGFDVFTDRLSSYPVYSDPIEYMGSADVVVDFSNAAALDKLLAYCTRQKTPIVLCTTGHSPEQLEQIREASELIPVFKSANMSVGINLLAALLKKAAAVLGDTFDVEIVERHHRSKVDAPSGTAIMLADAVSEGLAFDPEYVYERQSVRKKRDKREIGISAVRGGTIVGDHDVIFAGTDEVLEFKHIIYSREVFANGAVTAAAYISKIKEPGLYGMSDALTDILNR